MQAYIQAADSPRVDPATDLETAMHPSPPIQFVPKFFFLGINARICFWNYLEKKERKLNILSVLVSSSWEIRLIHVSLLE